MEGKELGKVDEVLSVPPDPHSGPSTGGSRPPQWALYGGLRTPTVAPLRGSAQGNGEDLVSRPPGVSYFLIQRAKDRVRSKWSWLSRVTANVCLPLCRHTAQEFRDIF